MTLPCICFFFFRRDVDYSPVALPSASASPRHHLEDQDSWPAVEQPTLRIAAGTRFAAKGTIAARVVARPEGTVLGSDNGPGLEKVELELENAEFDFENTVFDLEGIGRRGIVLGARAAGVARPGAASVGPYIRPEGPSGCWCTRVLAAGYRLALLLLPWASPPLHFSLAHCLRDRMLLSYRSFGILQSR